MVMFNLTLILTSSTKRARHVTPICDAREIRHGAIVRYAVTPPLRFAEGAKTETKKGELDRRNDARRMFIPYQSLHRINGSIMRFH